MKSCHFLVVKFPVYLNRRIFVMFYSTVKKWAAKFRRGMESMEDNERLGALKRLLQTKALIMCDKRNLHDIDSPIGIRFRTV